jgi:transposase
MGDSDPQPRMFYNISLEKFVPQDHPLRRIRPLIDDVAIRKACKPLYSRFGRPSIPPEQLFLALVGGYVLGVPSDRKLAMELQCNLALRWFVGLDLDRDAWDASTFSQNRRRRFDKSGVLELLFDETVARAMREGLVSRHVSADGTLVRANAGFKSFEPIEVPDPAEYKRRLRAQDTDDDEPKDPGNPTVNFRGEKRSNATHRSPTDPDCRFVTKRSLGAASFPGYTVNALMENRNRILLGIGVETFRSSASETEGCWDLVQRAKERLGYRPKTYGADKGFFAAAHIRRLLGAGIEPHIAVDRGKQPMHTAVRLRARSLGYRLSQRARKKIEELFGEAKDWHGMRRFRRRRLYRVRDEAWLIGWVLNLKRLATLLPREQTA